MKLADKIEVMQKALEGKKIESQFGVNSKWIDSTCNYGEINWDWHNFEYRVATEPKKLWVTVIEHSDKYKAYVSESEPEEYGGDSRNQTFEVEFTK